MDSCNCSGKKSPFMKKWMAQGHSSKEVSTVKEMNGRPLLLSSNKMAHYFKEWMTPDSVLKKYIVSTKS